MCIVTPLKMPSQDISYDYGLSYLIGTSRALAPPNGLIAYGHTLLSFYLYNLICYFSPYLHFLFVFDCTDCVLTESLVLAFWVVNAFLHPVLFLFFLFFVFWFFTIWHLRKYSFEHTIKNQISLRIWLIWELWLSQLATLLSSLIARRWVGLQTL